MALALPRLTPQAPAPSAPASVGDAHLVAIHLTAPSAPMPVQPPAHVLAQPSPAPVPSLNLSGGVRLPAPAPAPATTGILGSIAGALGMAPPQPASTSINLSGGTPAAPPPAPSGGILGSIAGALGMAPPQPTPVIVPPAPAGPQNYFPVAPQPAQQTPPVGPVQAVGQAIQGLGQTVAGALGLGSGSSSSSGGSPLKNWFGPGPSGGAASPSGQLVGGGSDASAGDQALAGYSVPPGIAASTQVVTPTASGGGFLTTKILGPITVAEAGLGALALGVVGKLAKWW